MNKQNYTLVSFRSGDHKIESMKCWCDKHNIKWEFEWGFSMEHGHWRDLWYFANERDAVLFALKFL